MRNISEFKLANQFNELETTYNTTYQAELVNGETVATQAAEQAVLVKYTEIKDSFLWVSNVWMPDTSANVIPSYERFLSLTQLEEAEQPEEGDYNKVMGVLRQEYSGWNGYYILIILAGAITYLSQKVMQGKLGQNKQKDQADGAPQVNMNFMLILFPVLMIIFTLSYSAAFALYIVINSAMSMFISMLSTNILNKIEAKKQNDTKPEYSR
jgi:membrane protein insertase Oxa1/YidC/SpoIIIJ